MENSQGSLIEKAISLMPERPTNSFTMGMLHGHESLGVWMRWNSAPNSARLVSARTIWGTILGFCFGDFRSNKSSPYISSAVELPGTQLALVIS